MPSIIWNDNNIWNDNETWTETQYAEVGTAIYITPPNGIQEQIQAYISCNVNLSITERAGSFNLELPFLSNYDFSRFVVGSDIVIVQNSNVFRGWVTKQPSKLNGIIKTISIEGADYTAKTQRILVTESYIWQSIDLIVADLCTKYLPWISEVSIQACSKPISEKFPDMFLWDCMERLCKLSGYSWYIDSDLVLHFFETASEINENIISDGTFKRGTANFSPDTSKLVNRLHVKGSKGLSLPFDQNISVSGTTPIPLLYKPRVKDDETITVVIGGVTKSVGIQNINQAGTYDFLINYNEKLLIPDLCTSGTGTITYRYEYPIKIILDNEVSQATYGLFEDIYNIETDDKNIAIELGQSYLDKYSSPVTIGSIEPFSGIYKPGQLIKVEVSALNINEYLVIKQVDYESQSNNGQQIGIKLSLENISGNLEDILKQFKNRLKKIEDELFGNSEDQSVEKYKLLSDTFTTPVMTDELTNVNLHDYWPCNTNFMSGTFYI